MSHVYLGTQYKCAWSGFTTIHVLEKAKIFFYRTVAERTVYAGFSGGAFLLRYGFGTLLVNVSTSLADEPNGKIPQFLEIVACIIYVCPFVAKPFYVVFDALNAFCVLLYRIGVIKTKIAYATIACCYAKVHGDGFGVADVQITIWLWGETGLYPSVVLAFCQVFLYLLFHKVQTSLLCAFFCRCHSRCFSCSCERLKFTLDVFSLQMP